MPNQQKYRPISFRPPEADRLWLLAYATETGRAVNAILAEALREYREAVCRIDGADGRVSTPHTLLLSPAPGRPQRHRPD